MSFSSTTATPTEVALYGNVTFTPTSGTYTVSGTQAISCNPASCSGPSAYATTGTYAISASGYGYISNQLLGSPVYGSVGATSEYFGSRILDWTIPGYQMTWVHAVLCSLVAVVFGFTFQLFWQDRSIAEPL